MRAKIRRVAFIGEVDRRVSECLRESGTLTEELGGDSIVGLVRELRRLQPAVVHVRANHLRVTLLAKLIGLPVVLQVTASDVSASTARAARMADRTLCGGSAVRNALVELGAPASTTTVVRSLLEVPASAQAIFPAVLDPALRWVVSAAPLDGPDRGQTDLLLAFLSVARTRPKVKLLIAGEGVMSQVLRAHADHAGFLSRVVVHPLPHGQLRGVFARAAAVVGPSRSNAHPDPVPEAQAAGAPVLATAVGSHPLWIREGRTGFLVPARAPVALAARLALLLDQTTLARKLAESGQAFALEQTHPRVVSQDLARIYSAVARPAPLAGLAGQSLGALSASSSPLQQI